MKIHFLNVGHGDMTLVEVCGKNILIDCYISEENYALDSIRKIFNNKIIDYLFITHLHDDHITGLEELVNDGFDIKNIFESGYREKDSKQKVYKYALDLFRKKSAIKLVASEEKINLDPDFSFYCYNSNNGMNDIHYNSLVIKIEENNHSILFAGDTNCEVWQEEIIPNFRYCINADILHASHHGSRSFFYCNNDEPNEVFSYKEHMKAIAPFYTIISAKRKDDVEEDWPPHNDAVELYKKYTKKSVLITGEEDNITLDLDEDIYNISETEKNLLTNDSITSQFDFVPEEYPFVTISKHSKPWCLYG